MCTSINLWLVKDTRDWVVGSLVLSMCQQNTSLSSMTPKNIGRNTSVGSSLKYAHIRV